MSFPRIVISALRGGSGKTLISIGLISALKSIGRPIAPFKKGPDYIDAGWLSLAGDRPCYNLDTFLINQPDILNTFISRTGTADTALIEGNRGLYDCISLDGDTSTAELAKLLKAPVVICLDCTKTTRTMAAVVSGCISFDPELEIKGVILNRVAGPRHEKNLQKNIEHYCGIPVLGALPKLDSQNFPERHMGLVPTHEHEWAMKSVESASKIAKKYLNLEKLAQIAEQASKKPVLQPETITTQIPAANKDNIKIGIIRDSAFQFYYPENIEALKSYGAQCIYISPFTSKSIPDIDGLYIGGGFPETHAKELSENKRFAQELKKLADKGLPIYAECGGLMFLGEKLIIDGISYSMSGVLPITFGFSPKPQGHGYTIVQVTGENPYYKTGTQIRGHEFHYSSVLECRNDENMVFTMKRGKGIKDKMDGFCYKNVLATYTHIHSLGTPAWAEAMAANAAAWKKAKTA